MTIADFNKALSELHEIIDFNDNAEIKIDTDARSTKDVVRIHVHPSDGVDIFLSKRIDTKRSSEYSNMRGV